MEYMLGHIQRPLLLFFTCLGCGVHLLAGSILCAALLYEKPNFQGSNFKINLDITNGDSNGQCKSVSSLLLVGGHHSAARVHHTSHTTCVDSLSL